MRARAIIVALVTAAAAPAVAPAEASSTAVSRIDAVYRSVLTAEYFGPASAVCSRLTAAGVKSFTAGRPATCRKAFAAQQHLLKHKIKGVDNSGYTPAAWRTVVNMVMAQLKVRVHGSHATAVGGQTGIPGQTKLLRVKGKWLFDSYPPSVQP